MTVESPSVSFFNVKEVKELRNRVEQLEVQLAGCGVAALGYGEELEQDAYGWSQSYADVMLLRKKYDKLIADRSGGDW